MRRTVIVALLAWASCTVAWSTEPERAKAQASTADAADPMQDWLAKLTPDQRERINAYQSHQARLKEQLRASAEPRDWAMSTQLLLVSGPYDKNDDAVTLMRNAASAAPTDVLVQWWAGNAREHAAGTCGVSLPRPEIVAALQALERDNGAVWMLGLDAALQAKDDDAVDRVLIQIAASKDFDTHFIDAFKAWTKAYERFGLPQWPSMAESSDDGIPSSASAQRQVLALGQAAGNTPSYYALSQACKVKAADAGKQFRRASLCEEAGRHMATVSRSMLDAGVGLSIVRMAGREQTQDIERARQLDWLQGSLAKQAVAADVDKFFEDLSTTGNELEAHRRALQRAQLETLAPAWWQPSLEEDDDSEDD